MNKTHGGSGSGSSRRRGGTSTRDALAACLSRVPRRVARTVLRGLRRGNAPELPDCARRTGLAGSCSPSPGTGSWVLGTQLLEDGGVFDLAVAREQECLRHDLGGLGGVVGERQGEPAAGVWPGRDDADRATGAGGPRAGRPGPGGSAAGARQGTGGAGSSDVR